MSQLNMCENQYVLSLDSLDLSLLSQYIEKPSDERRLIWSKSYIDGESTYCKVNIESDEFEDDDSHLQPAETFFCHICNTHVPQIYYKQHKNSKLHQDYRKLTKKVLENLSKYIDTDLDIVVSNKDNTVYCETCCKVVSVKYKKAHNKSGYHLKSKEKYELTEKFIEIYLDDKNYESENVDIKEESNNETINEEKHDNASDSEYFSETDDYQLTNDNSVIHTKDSLFPINNVMYEASDLNSSRPSSDSDNDSVESDVSVRLHPDTMEEIANFITYLKEIMVKHNLQIKMPIVKDDSLVIVTPKALKQKIRIWDFHGFKYIGCFIFCQLCNCWVDNYTEHVSAIDHVKNIAQPVDDTFARKVERTDRWIHCLLCNIMVIKGSDHASFHNNIATQENETKDDISTTVSVSNTCDETAEHDHLKNTKTGNNKPVCLEILNNNSTPKQTFCDACDKYIDTHNLSGHVKGRIHIENLMGPKVSDEVDKSNRTDDKVQTNKSSNVVQSNVSNKKVIPTKISHRYINGETIEQTYCDACDRYIDTHNFVAHSTSYIHKHNLKTKGVEAPVSVEVTKTSFNNSKNQTYCDACDRYIHTHNFKAHSNGKLHKHNLKIKTEKAGPNVIVKDNATPRDDQNDSRYCNLCKVKVPSGGMKIHEMGKPHRMKNINKALDQIKTDLEEYASQSEKSISNQNTTNSMTNMNDLPSTSNTPDAIVTHDNVADVLHKGKVIQYKKQMSSIDANKLECMVCNVKVPNIDINIIEHVEDLKHKSQQLNLLSISKIKEISYYFFYCEICDLHFNNFIIHINEDEDHKAKFFALYKHQIHEHVYDYPLITDSIACNFRLLHNHMLRRNKIKRVSDTIFYYCNLCSISFCRRSEIDHMLSDKHLKSLNVLAFPHL